MCANRFKLLSTHFRVHFTPELLTGSLRFTISVKQKNTGVLAVVTGRT